MGNRYDGTGGGQREIWAPAAPLLMWAVAQPASAADWALHQTMND